MEEKYLLWLLRVSLTGESGSVQSDAMWGSGEVQMVDWDKLCFTAERHSVLPFLYDLLAENGQVPEHVRERVTAAARRTVNQSYHILFLCKYLIGRLEAEGITAVVLKGVATASFYPVPELRKAGDIDLLLTDPKTLKRAGEILKECGCVLSEEQHARHHVAYETVEGIGIEIHVLLAEPFDNNRINQYLKNKLPECSRNIVRADCMGVSLPILDVGYHAYELLLHMLQHFLYAGFGLKLLCDWVVFWNREADSVEREKYLTMVKESGVKGFADIITCTCIRYLGLRKEAVDFMELPEDDDFSQVFLEEVLAAEEFGRSQSDRMVALRSSSPSAYVREFQHQMHLNFPRAGKCFLFWPVLWGITLGRFLRNNRTVRNNASAVAILKNARKRGSLIARMQLWK